MAVLCPKCGREYDVSLFQFGQNVRCVCGATFGASSGSTGRKEGSSPTWHDELFRELRSEERKKVEELRRLADEVTRLILNESIPEIDVRIALERVREKAQELFPDRMDLYEMIYESRFKRLWEQFRNQDVK